MCCSDCLLTVDEIGAINLYTQNTPFYRVLNEVLRSRKRDDAKQLLSYLKLLITGINKLPVTKTTLFRGMTQFNSKRSSIKHAKTEMKH